MTVALRIIGVVGAIASGLLWQDPLAMTFFGGLVMAGQAPRGIDRHVDRLTRRPDYALIDDLERDLKMGPYS